MKPFVTKQIMSEPLGKQQRITQRMGACFFILILNLLHSSLHLCAKVQNRFIEGIFSCCTRCHFSMTGQCCKDGERDGIHIDFVGLNWISSK